MNENIDLTKILDGCPEGTEFYSILHDKVSFRGIDSDSDYPVTFDSSIIAGSICLTKNGRALYQVGECIIFPSKDQRDWSKFEYKMSHAPQPEKDKAKRLYRNYKFIRDSINNTHTSTEELYYVLIRKAAIYIDFIEDGINHDNEFPLDILDMFELNSWFNDNFDRYRTNEIMVVLINKIFSSSYRDLFI